MPTTDPRLTVRAVRPLVSGLRALGDDVAPLFAAVGLDPAVLERPDAYVPMGVVPSLIARAVEVTGDDQLGLHIAEHLEPQSLDVHFYAMLSSPTLGEGYRRLCRYQRLIHETTRVELGLGDDKAVLRHVMPGDVPAPRQSAEFLLAVWVRGGRLATGQDWAPTEVRFAHPAPAATGEYACFFGAPVQFGTGENALVLARSLLDLPCVRADPTLLAVLDQYASDRLETAAQTSSVADRARAALIEMFRGGDPSSQGLASRLKMSSRTLSRALAVEGTSYRQLRDQLRHQLATRHLREDRLSISEVAFLLGFSEISAFYRAFKRWTSQTPAEFRRAHQRTTAS